ncbi:MAG TPA: hypothetical protein ENK19_03440 [Acidobacteria bacterium]|nr:hypothetical protein [Acidobacteriota bacterium]
MRVASGRFTGSNLDEALTAACNGLGARLGEIHYEIIDETAEEVSVEAVLDPAAILGLFLSEAFAAGELDLRAHLQETEEAIVVDIEGPDTTLLRTRGGEALDGLQYLANRILDGRLPEHLPVHMDIGAFKAQRADELHRKAEEAARAATRTGRPQTLAPMTPAARREIHLALADDERVETESEGRGFIKRVVVRPRRRR